MERPPAKAAAAAEDAGNGNGSGSGSSSGSSSGSCSAGKRDRLDATEKGGGHETAAAAAATLKQPVSSPSPPSTPKAKRMRTRNQDGGTDCGEGEGGDVLSPISSGAAAAELSHDAFSPLRAAAKAKVEAAATVTFNSSRSPRKSPRSPGRPGPGARAAAAASKDTAQCKLTLLWQKPPG